MLRIEHYGKSRYWAVYDGHELVVVTLYKRGAQEVQRRLAAQPPAATEAAAQAAAVDAAARQAQALAAQAARARAQPAGPGGLGGTPRANLPRWRRARRPACGPRWCGASPPGAPRRHPSPCGAGPEADCVAETPVV